MKALVIALTALVAVLLLDNRAKQEALNRDKATDFEAQIDLLTKEREQLRAEVNRLKVTIQPPVNSDKKPSWLDQRLTESPRRLESGAYNRSYVTSAPSYQTSRYWVDAAGVRHYY